MAEIARTATEPVTLTWLQDGAPVTGASPTMRVRRASDDFSTVYDWTALAFVDPATAVAPFVVLAPTDPTYEPGVYWHAFEPQSASNAAASDIYRVTYYADATLDAPRGTAEIRVGTVDTIDTTAVDVIAAQTDIATILGYTPAASAAAVWATVITGNETLGQAGGALNVLRAGMLNRLEEADGNPGTLKLYKGDAATLWLTWQLRDKSGGAVTGAAGEPARRAAAT